MLLIIWVYPRVCGGTTAVVPYRPLDPGLSPRVRGNPKTTGSNKGGYGSIPACAGEPTRLARRHTTRRVYPRVCGGTGHSASVFFSASGLSPRVRGNRPVGANVRPCMGSIPACAGEPKWHASGRSSLRVYPRVCGGTDLGPRTVDRTTGLSPRVRGNRDPDLRRVPRRGSIPACAGEPVSRC